LSIEAEVQNEFFGCACDATEICVQTNEVLVVDFDLRAALLRRRRRSCALRARFFSNRLLATVILLHTVS
jgi:hypothetical protein